MKWDLSELFSYLKHDDDAEQLKKIKILDRFSRYEMRNLSKYLLRREFKAGDYIFKENYPHVVLYFIIEGEVEIFLEKPDKNIPISKIGVGDHFGEIGLFVHSNRIATARAVTDTLLLAFSKNDFKRFIRKNNSSGIKLLYKLAQVLSMNIIENNKNRA